MEMPSWWLSCGMEMRANCAPSMRLARNASAYRSNAATTPSFPPSADRAHSRPSTLITISTSSSVHCVSGRAGSAARSSGVSPLPVYVGVPGSAPHTGVRGLGAGPSAPLGAKVGVAVPGPELEFCLLGDLSQERKGGCGLSAMVVAVVPPDAFEARSRPHSLRVRGNMPTRGDVKFILVSYCSLAYK